jgi:hypothetical protein
VHARWEIPGLCVRVQAHVQTHLAWRFVWGVRTWWHGPDDGGAGSSAPPFTHVLAACSAVCDSCRCRRLWRPDIATLGRPARTGQPSCACLGRWNLRQPGRVEGMADSPRRRLRGMGETPPGSSTTGIREKLTAPVGAEAAARVHRIETSGQAAHAKIEAHSGQQQIEGRFGSGCCDWFTKDWCEPDCLVVDRGRCSPCGRSGGPRKTFPTSAYCRPLGGTGVENRLSDCRGCSLARGGHRDTAKLTFGRLVP